MSLLRFRKNKKEFGPKPQESIITPTNRDEFIEMMTSKKGYFLLNSFPLSADHRQLKLDDAILQAQLHGKSKHQLQFLFKR